MGPKAVWYKISTKATGYFPFNPMPIICLNLLLIVGCMANNNGQQGENSNLEMTQNKERVSEITGSLNLEDGKVVFVSIENGDSEIYLMDGDGGNRVRLTQNNSHESAPSWSPNGEQIAFLSREGQYTSLILMDLENRSIIQLLKKNEFLENPLWSPNGEWIVLGISGELFLISLDLKNEIQLTDFGDFIWSAPHAWSQDSNRILFSSNYQVPGRAISETMLYSLNVKDQVVEAITDKQYSYLRSADWSSNEQGIVYSAGLHTPVLDVSNLGEDTAIVSMIMQHTESLSCRRNEMDASWLPDNQHIIFSMSDCEENLDIYVLDIPTGELVRLTNEIANDNQPAWWSPQMNSQ